MKHRLTIFLLGFFLAGLGLAILAASGPLPPNTARISVSVFLRITPTTVTLTAPDPKATESEAGLDRGMFLVTRSGDKSKMLTVNFTTSGTAGNGVDYNEISSPVKIPAGAASAAIEIRPIKDTLAEKGETVILTLSTNSNYNIGSPNRATVTIYDQSAVDQWTLYD